MYLKKRSQRIFINFGLVTIFTATAVIGATPAFQSEAQADLPLCGSNSSTPLSVRTMITPSIGTEREIEVGGAIISTAQSGVAVSGLRLISEASVIGKRAGAEFVVKLPAGDLPHPGLNRDVFNVPTATFKYDRDKDVRHGLSKPDIGIYISPVDDTQLIARLNFGLSKTDVPILGAQFIINRCLRMAAKGLRREILYSGGAKGSISLQYREFLNGHARPGFSQDLSYDLADGKEIGFKGARIRIEKVSNTGLQYTLLKGLAE